MPLLTQKIKDQRKDDANDYGRHDGKVEDEFAARTSYLMSPGSKDSADASSLLWSARLLETYDTSPSANMMVPAVSRNVVMTIAAVP